MIDEETLKLWEACDDSDIPGLDLIAEVRRLRAAIDGYEAELAMIRAQAAFDKVLLRVQQKELGPLQNLAKVADAWEAHSDPGGCHIANLTSAVRRWRAYEDAKAKTFPSRIEVKP